MGYVASSVSAGSPSPLKFGHFLLCFPSHYFICNHFLLGIFSLLSSTLLFLSLFTFLYCFSFFSFPFESIFFPFSVINFLILLSPFGSCFYFTPNFFSFSFSKLASFFFFHSCYFLLFHRLLFPILSTASSAGSLSEYFLLFPVCTLNPADTMNSNFPGSPIIIPGSDPSMLLSHA